MRRILHIFAAFSLTLLICSCVPGGGWGMSSSPQSNPAGPRKGRGDRNFTYHPLHHEASFYTDGKILLIVFEKYQGFLEFNLEALSEEIEPNKKNTVKASDAIDLQTIDLTKYYEIESGYTVMYDPEKEILLQSFDPLPENRNEIEIFRYSYEYLSPNITKPTTLSYCVRNESIGTRFIYIKPKINPRERDSSGQFTL